MTRTTGVCLVLLLVSGCASAPRVRLVAESPRAPTVGIRPPSYDLPTPAWPVRWGSQPPQILRAAETISWELPPSLGTPPVPVVAVAQPEVPPQLPLPQVVPLPVKATPSSRSWTTVAQAKTSAPLKVPVPPAVVAAAAAPKSKADTKAATVPAVAQPAPTPKVTSPSTPAATATLLPADTPESADFQWQDVNATAGDSVTLHFDKTNWLYLDTPAQQKTLGFQTINRDKDATTFVFKPLVPGQYTLEFQRQDLVNQATDRRKVNLTVAKPGTRTASTGTVSAPQTSNQAANDALEASRQLSAAGKTAEAIQKLLQTYKADDARTNLELARLLNQGGQDDEALGYLDKNLTLPGPDFQGTLELGTRLAATRDPQKKLPTYVKLWTAGTTAPPEDLYIQVLESLRTQKLAAQVKEWSGRYASWYPAPKLRDRYLYQVGQWLEEPGETRDIRGAWKAYNEVVQAYPLSPFWKLAGERAAYLNRHFLQVR